MAGTSCAGDAFSNETAEEFTARMSKVVSSGLHCIAITMGIETGLFQVMIDLGQPKTSQQIADAGNFKERYVRECLGAVTAIHIVEYNASDETYWLPAQRHSIAGSLRATALAMAIPNLCQAFFNVSECFKKDGPPGVPYEKYGKFDELMTGLHKGFFKEQLVQRFLPTMPKLYQQLKEGIRVLEIGCNQGISTRVIAQHFPKSQVVGLDITEEGIRLAAESAREEGLDNVQFVCMSATTLPADWSASYDFVFMHNVLHDLPHPVETLHELHRVLKVGGTMSVIDTASHTKLEDNLAHLRTFASDAFVLSMMNCVPTSLSVEGATLGLGAMWGREKAQEIIKGAGFEVVSVTPVDTRTSLHYQCRKP